MTDAGFPRVDFATAMVIHVEQILENDGGACHCGKDAVLIVMSEPDMEPGPLCAEHGLDWIRCTVGLLRAMFRVK